MREKLTTRHLLLGKFDERANRAEAHLVAERERRLFRCHYGNRAETQRAGREKLSSGRLSTSISFEEILSQHFSFHRETFPFWHGLAVQICISTRARRGIDSIDSSSRVELHVNARGIMRAGTIEKKRNFYWGVRAA